MSSIVEIGYDPSVSNHLVTSARGRCTEVHSYPMQQRVIGLCVALLGPMSQRIQSTKIEKTMVPGSIFVVGSRYTRKQVGAILIMVP